MTLETKKPVGKKHTIASITKDLSNGAWNNLDLSKSSKRAFIGSGAIILLGAAAAYSQIKRK
jgi:hypothetical protein